MEKEVEELEEGSEVDIHFDSQRSTFKKIPNWKTPAHDAVRGFGLKKTHSRNLKTDRATE